MQDDALVDAADVHELSTLCIKSLRPYLPAEGSVVVAGVGFGGVLAHELALALSAMSPGSVAGLVLMEGQHVMTADVLGLSPEGAEELAQVRRRVAGRTAQKGSGFLPGASDRSASQKKERPGARLAPAL